MWCEGSLEVTYWMEMEGHVLGFRDSGTRITDLIFRLVLWGAFCEVVNGRV